MSNLSPAVILYDAAGVAMSVSNGVAIPAGTTALLVAGSDGANARLLKTAADGTLVTQFGGAQPTLIQDSTGTFKATVFPAGFLRTTDEPHQLFYDPFDGNLDTTNLWNVPVAAGGGVAAAHAAAILTLGSGTTANGYSYIQSRAAFTPTVPGWLGVSFANKFEFPVVTNSFRFWGAGNPATTPTTAAPIVDGYGFELDTAGKMFAVVYAAGVRTAVQDLSSTGNNKQPLDANYHRFIVIYRTDKTFWYIDGIDGANLVASANFVSPSIQSLPAMFLTVAGATPPASSAVITSTGLAAWDTAKNNSTLSDGTYGWRKAQVGAFGGLTTQASSRKAVETTRYDLSVTNANLYVGVAPRGSASSASVWTIYRTIMVLGSPTITEQTGSAAIWDNRVTETYL